MLVKATFKLNIKCMQGAINKFIYLRDSCMSLDGDGSELRQTFLLLTNLTFQELFKALRMKLPAIIFILAIMSK